MTRAFRFFTYCLILAASSEICAQVSPPPTVLGKEYITEPNTNALGIPTTGQTVGWSGAGPAFDLFVLSPFELDAIAHMGDAHFEGLIADEAALIVSFRTAMPGGPAIDPIIGAGVPASYWYKNSTPFGGTTGVWATAPMLNPIAPPMQVSGAEFWGAAGDTTHWSTFGDAGGVSVTSGAGPYLLTAEIEFAIGATIGIDVDAFFLLDHFGGTDLFHVGDMALMSVKANGQFDGGEIWLLSRTAGGVLSASFFSHGGVTFDTAFDVAGHFGMFPPTQEIDAIEAIVPEPATIGLLVLGASALSVRRRRS